MKRNLLSVLAVATTVCANAAITSVPVGNVKLAAAVGAANPGDTLELVTGEYTEPYSFNLDKAGLVIRAAEGQKPVVKASSYLNFHASVTLEGILFDGQNTAEYTVYARENTAKNLTFRNCTFTGYTKYNITGSGSSAHLDSLIVDGCLFRDNGGSAVYMPASGLADNVPGCNYFRMTNSTVYNVGAATGCAAIDVRENTNAYTQNQVEVIVDHVTLYNYQTAGNGGIMSYKSANVQITNTIVANPEGSELYGTYVYGGEVKNCLFNNVIHRTTSVQSGCLTGDPLFTDAPNGDFSLKEGSPALAAATDGTNLGDPRWNKGTTPDPEPEPEPETEEIVIDLSTAANVNGTNCSWTLGDDGLAVTYDFSDAAAGSWPNGGVEFALDNVEKVVAMAFDFKGSATIAQWTSFQAYLKDSEGIRWYSQAKDLHINGVPDWTHEEYMPHDALWAEPSHTVGDCPFVAIGFLANCADPATDTFCLRNVKVIVEANGISSAVEETREEGKAVKVIRNGQLLIIRDGKTYNALGQQR